VGAAIHDCELEIRQGQSSEKLEGLDPAKFSLSRFMEGRQNSSMPNSAGGFVFVNVQTGDQTMDCFPESWRVSAIHSGIAPLGLTTTDSATLIDIRIPGVPPERKLLSLQTGRATRRMRNKLHCHVNSWATRRVGRGGLEARRLRPVDLAN